MDREEAEAGGLSVVVEDIVIKKAVAQEHADDDQEGDDVQKHILPRLEEARDADDHLTEGQDHEQQISLGEVREVTRSRLIGTELTGFCDIAVNQRKRREHDAGGFMHRDRHEDDAALDEMMDDIRPEYPPVDVIEMRGETQLIPASIREVQHDQCPGSVVADIVIEPVVVRAARHVVQEIHINEDTDVIPEGFSAVTVEKHRGKHPDLHDDRGQKKEGLDRAYRWEGVLIGMKQCVDRTEAVHEDEVEKELDILDLLFDDAGDGLLAFVIHAGPDAVEQGVFGVRAQSLLGL